MMTYNESKYILNEVCLSEGIISDKVKNLLSKYITKQRLDKVASSFKKFINEVSKDVRDAGVNISKLKTNAKKIAKNILPKLNKSLNPKELTALIKTETLKSIKELGYSDVGRIEDRIVKSIFLLFIVIVLSVLFAGVFVITGPMIGVSVYALLAIVVAPIVEEWAKSKAVREKFGDTYIHIFAWYEFARYVWKILFAVILYGLNYSVILKFVFLRTLSVGMHYLTYYIHRAYQDKAEKGEEDSLARKALLITITIHASWNAMAIIFSRDIVQWVMN